MKYLIVLTCIIAGALAKPSTQNLATYFENLNGNKIISGTEAEVGEIPWQVAVHFTRSTGTHFCGGALINDMWVLTAAHCAQGAMNFTLRFGGLTLVPGEEGRVDVETSTYFVHPDYNANVHNDVALVKLPAPVQYSERIQPVRLPAKGEQIENDRVVYVSGWGKTSDSSSTVSPVLFYVQLNTISNRECQDIFGNGIVIESTVCCRGDGTRSTCNGDSGGPLVVYDENQRATHIGVVSWVHIDGCESQNPSGYVRTEAMLDWIYATLEANK